MKINNSVRNVLTAVMVFSTITASSVCEAKSNVYAANRDAGKYIALTFDDGPHPVYTEKILDILKKNNAKATFFIIGKNAESYPNIVKKEYEMGHEIGNHTYSHPDMNKISVDKAVEEILLTQDILTNITGKKPTLFRAPGGIFSEELIVEVEELDCKPILWSWRQDTKDWNNVSVSSIVKCVLDNLQNGDIILLHATAVLSEGSTAESKTYTMATEETDEEGNVINYVWTEEDTTALNDAIAALGIEGASVSSSEDKLYVSVTGTSSVEWLSTDTVSAEISAGLRDSAIKATLLAVVLMLIYIAFRFQISSAFAAIVCLVHDLFVMLVAYSIFQIPVNSTIIAALLTILGYSINATIIIFDRIRENDKKFTDGEGFSVKVDDGIRNTIWRSINTTLTTLFTIGMIYFLGVTSIKNFALPLIVGIIAGLFSSVCLAGPLWRVFKKLGKKIRNK